MLFYLDKDYLQCLHKVYLYTLYLHKDYFQCLCTFFFFFFFFFIWVLQPFQEYFAYIAPVVHQRWLKTGESREKPPDHL